MTPTTTILIVALLIACLGTVTAAEQPAMTLVEAESFTERGGWVVDQQSMDVMGSPYLLAHGLGVPVVDATTDVKLPSAGTYRIWVRTRDWTAPWKGPRVPEPLRAEGSPGLFKVLVNDKPLPPTFGEQGSAWHWQDAGTIEITAPQIKVALHDLTGFEGRCEAILFVNGDGKSWQPPGELKELSSLRRQLLSLPDDPVDAGAYDLVVIGGGYAGLCASIAAARLGLKVALIQDRPVLGGNASCEVRVGPIGGLNEGPFPHNGDIVKEIRRGPGTMHSSGGLRARPNDPHLLNLVQAEKNISLFLETHAYRVETDGARIRAVLTKHIRTSAEQRFRGTLFADCTGDATIGFLAGAEWRQGREARTETGESMAPERSDQLLLGVTNFWIAKDTDRSVAFPACPWALKIDATSVEVSSPKFPPKFGEYAYVGGWNWESGFRHDPITEIEYIRDYNFRAIYGTWDFLKNRSADRAKYANAQLQWAAFIAGKRESRRLMGDLVLTEQDIVSGKPYPDGCVTATWYFDLHYPHPDNARQFSGEAFRSLAYDDPNFEKLRGEIPGKFTEIEPYAIPYRCLYSRNVPNLFMAGRNISVTHAGLAPVRTMNTTGMMGTVVGRAAFLCQRLKVDPRALYEQHLDGLKRLLAEPDGAKDQ